LILNWQGEMQNKLGLSGRNIGGEEHQLGPHREATADEVHLAKWILLQNDTSKG
jgi:hypothetical protein